MTDHCCTRCRRCSTSWSAVTAGYGSWRARCTRLRGRAPRTWLLHAATRTPCTKKKHRSSRLASLALSQYQRLHNGGVCVSRNNERVISAAARAAAILRQADVMPGLQQSAAQPHACSTNEIKSIPAFRKGCKSYLQYCTTSCLGLQCCEATSRNK